MNTEQCKECGRPFYEEENTFEKFIDGFKILLIFLFLSIVPLAAIKVLFFI